MTRYDPILNSFVSGELSPKLAARDDLVHYKQGARRIRNMLVVPQGGATRRSGTRFVNEVANSANFTMLVPFKFSTTNVYALEFSNLLIRAYINEGVLESSPGLPVTVVSPYTSAQLPKIQWAQTADFLYLVHPDHPPYRLTRTSATSFTMAPVSFSKGRAPLRPYNTDTASYPSANAVGSVFDRSLTWSVPHGWTSADLGRVLFIYRYKKSASPAYRAASYTIKSIVSTTVIEVDIDWEDDTGDGDAILGEDAFTWATGLFSATEGCNAVTFHEGRLAFGGFKAKLDYFALSVSDDFENFQFASGDPGVADAENDDKAIGRRTVSRESNAILWLASTNQVLVVGTAGGEFIVKGTTDGILTPTGTVVKPATTRGSAPHSPEVVDGAVHFLQRNGSRIRRFDYSLDNDQYVAGDQTALAEHLARIGMVSMVYQQDPHSVLWVLLADGRLAGFTVEREQDIVAAHLHTLGGDFQGGPAIVESLCVVDGDNSGSREDQLWLVVKRTVNGATKRYVEFVEGYFDPAHDPNATRWELSGLLDRAFFVDSGLTLDAPLAVTAISNASPGLVTTAVSHGLVAGDRVKFRGVGGRAGVNLYGMAELDQRSYKVLATPTLTTFTLASVDTGAALNTSAMSPFADPFGTAKVYKEVSSVTGLGHLEGQTVAVLADGAVHPTAVVSGGSVALVHPASLVHVGLPFTSLLETMPIVGGGVRGTDQGRPTGTGRTTVRLYNSVGGKLGRGPTPAYFETIVGRKGADAMDRPPPLFTGDREVTLGSSHELDPTITIVQDQPLPLTILGLMPRMQSATDV